MNSTIEIFLLFLRLGLTSFGGPIAHLGYFHNEFVLKRKWFDQQAYADLVALCQFLPGPASSQVGIAIGLSRGGVLGAIAAWLGFTLPSALLLMLFALGISNYPEYIGKGWLHGLKIAAVAIVAQALWAMARKLCPDFKRAAIGLAAAAIAFFVPSVAGQILGIFAGGILALFLLYEPKELPHSPISTRLRRSFALTSLALFLVGISLLPMAASQLESHGLKMFDSFFRAGALVFGGGHVVLPLLKAEVVNSGWVSADSFTAGYGAAQAVPGPLFSFAAYLGAVSSGKPTGVSGAFLCLIAAFLPSFLLVFSVLPFWEKLRRIQKIRIGMLGINAAVVGLLLNAFYDPVWRNSIFTIWDLAIASICLVLLIALKTPSWMIVAVSAVAGASLQHLT